MHLLNPLSIARARELYQPTKVLASCLSSDAVGSCVYVVGAAIGDYLQVRTVSPTVATNIPAVGIIVSKESSATCTVQLFGITTILTGLIPGSDYFIDLDGTLTAALPLAPPGQKYYIQPMGRALSDDQFYVSPSASIIKRIG